MAEPRFDVTTLGEMLVRLSVPSGKRLEAASQLDVYPRRHAARRGSRGSAPVARRPVRRHHRESRREKQGRERPHGGAEDVLGVVAQRGRVRRRPGPDASREDFPIREDGFDVCKNEVGQPHQ